LPVAAANLQISPVMINLRAGRAPAASRCKTLRAGRTARCASTCGSRRMATMC
jgi:hypothetical protein